MSKKIILLAGPTASGKSKLAIHLAKKLNGEIINADSMQIYKEFTILSSRPNKSELKKYYENYEMDIISLRLSTIYGHRRSTSCFINDIINSGIKNKEITLPFKSDFCWPYVYVDDVVSCIEKCLFHQKEHFYDYNVSGPDFPSYHKIVNEVSQHIGNLQVNFLNYNSVSERKLFSLNKIKNDIQWEPKYSIERGIKDYIDNIV